MARAPKDTTPKPTKPEPISLLRIEERVERIPITAEQAQERMQAAAGVLIEAQMLDSRFIDLRESAKQAKQAAEAKHAEADRIVLDARNGTVAAPYPVIVERHPTHPAEMIVWRAPDGVLPQDIRHIDPPVAEAEHFGAREAQGCTLIETRAMTGAELEEATRHANPTLPLDNLDAPAGGGAAPDGGGTVHSMEEARRAAEAAAAAAGGATTPGA